MDILILYISLSVLIFPSKSLLCGEEEIEHCLECGNGENYETCSLCEDKYFLFMNNVLCIPCDDPIYGQYGCQGKCDSTNYERIRNVICEANACKEGFYYLEGICVSCKTVIENCHKCSYTPPNFFTCHNCISNQYKIENDGKCHKCNIGNCTECSYENDQPVCNKCNNNYYVNSYKKCSKCHSPIYIPGGECTICSDNLTDYENGYCSCYENFTKSSISACMSCPENCNYCIYNQSLKITICNK